MMERSEIMTTMGELKLFGMRAAYDEIVTSAVKRQHEPQRVVSDLLTAELSEKQARSIKYQIAIAKLPLAKEIEDFVFDDTPVNETLVRDLAGSTARARVTSVNTVPSAAGLASSAEPMRARGSPVVPKPGISMAPFSAS